MFDFWASPEFVKVADDLDTKIIKIMNASSRTLRNLDVTYHPQIHNFSVLLKLVLQAVPIFPLLTFTFLHGLFSSVLLSSREKSERVGISFTCAQLGREVSFLKDSLILH